MAAPRSEPDVSAILHGVTATTLGQIFGLDPKDVQKRIVGKVAPVSTQSNYLKYRIRDAAPYLIELKVNPEEYIKSLSPAKLPPPLQDAFWKAQLSRQKYEEQRGDLWRTRRVFEVVSTAFKACRLTVLMFNDTVEQRTELTDQQREVIQELSDGLLGSFVKALDEAFAGYEPKDDEHGMPLGEQVLIEAPEAPELDTDAIASATQRAYLSEQEREAEDDIQW